MDGMSQNGWDGTEWDRMEKGKMLELEEDF